MNSGFTANLYGVGAVDDKEADDEVEPKGEVEPYDEAETENGAKGGGDASGFFDKTSSSFFRGMNGGSDAALK